MIEIKDLIKQYPKAISPAVNSISIHIKEGAFFGLFGPNGAGKTTTISILCGLIRANAGSAKINGLDVQNDSEQLKHFIGVVPQEIALFPSLTARENLRYFGKMYGIPEPELTQRITQYLDMFGLLQNANRLLETFSGGMKRRTNLIAGILHHPKLLFLDEPTVGIDVQSKAVINQFLRELNQSGTTIVYTSHHLKEAESLCNAIAIIDQGKIVTTGQPQQLIASCEGAKHLEDVFLALTGEALRD